MIEFVRGTVTRIGIDHAVVDVSGIGLRVQAAPSTLAGLEQGQPHQLPTALVVREDSWTLYGFDNVEEREIFEIVQTVSGIGPRTAQALIGTLSGRGVRKAVAAADEASLTRAPGIGRKGAQRMILELADKLSPLDGDEMAENLVIPAAELKPPWRADVHAGLMSLGWNAREAGDAIDLAASKFSTVAGGSVETVSVSEGMRAALQELNRS